MANGRKTDGSGGDAGTGRPSALRRMLDERGLSVNAFARMAGISPRTLEAYALGKKTFEKAQAWMLFRVADALGVDPRELLESDGPIRKESRKRTYADGVKPGSLVERDE